MLEWIKCDKTPLFVENLSEQLHSIARRVFCVGTLNFWKAFERLGAPGGVWKAGTARSGGGGGGGYWNQLSHVTPCIKHCSMPATVGQWPVKFFLAIERKFTWGFVRRSEKRWMCRMSRIISLDTNTSIKYKIQIRIQTQNTKWKYWAERRLTTVCQGEKRLVVNCQGLSALIQTQIRMQIQIQIRIKIQIQTQNTKCKHWAKRRFTTVGHSEKRLVCRLWRIIWLDTTTG